MIIETRARIKELLEQGFDELKLKRPYINITGFPESKEQLEQIQKTAKMYSSGAIFITWTAERPGEKIAEIYTKFIDVFTLFLFSNDKRDDTEIIQLYETARNILQREFYLYHGEMSPVKTANTGLWMAALQVGKINIYQGFNHVSIKR